MRWFIVFVCLARAVAGVGIPSRGALDELVQANAPGTPLPQLDHRVPFSRIDTTSCEPDFYATFSNPAKKSATLACEFTFTRQPITVQIDVGGPFTSASVEFQSLALEPYQVNKYASSLMGYANLNIETEDFDYNNHNIVARVAIPVNSSYIRPASLARLSDTFHVTFGNLKTERFSSLADAVASNMYYGRISNSTSDYTHMIVFELNLAEGDNQFSALQTLNPESINGIQQLTAGDTVHLAVSYSDFLISIFGMLFAVSALILAVYTLRKARSDELEDIAREDRLRRRLDALEGNVTAAAVSTAPPAGNRARGMHFQ